MIPICLSVSVIVAARNEENDILECIQSLDKLEFPAGKIEIILVDDNSTDRTGEIIDEFIADKPKFKKSTFWKNPEVT